MQATDRGAEPQLRPALATWSLAISLGLSFCISKNRGWPQLNNNDALTPSTSCWSINAALSKNSALSSPKCGFPPKLSHCNNEFLLSEYTNVVYLILKALSWGPGQVAQLVGASSPTPKGCGFDPWPGHIWEATDGCFLHVDDSLSLPAKINKHILR